MLENALRDTASWLATTWSSSTVFQVLACVITNSKGNNLNQMENYHQYAHKMLWNACTWHELGDLTFFGPWTNLQGAVTKWTQACDRRLARLISYIHHTHDYRQHCHVAQHCRLELFQDSDFAGDLEDSNSTSGGVLCIFGSPSVECARNRRQYPIVPQNLK